MGTCNGAHFLEPQLAIIASQTFLPAELVVCDDQSTDESAAIVERFAAHAPFEVRVVRNPGRLGFAENFLQAARLSRGDVIAWCDQDDVWMKDKLAGCVREFTRDPEVMLVVHSRRIGDWTRHSRSVVRSADGKWVTGLHQARAGRRTVHTPASLPLENSYPGYASLISRRAVEIANTVAVTLPGIVSQFTGHDTWTSFVAGAVGKVVLVPDVLAHYRQHTDQVTGGAARPQSLAGRAQTSLARPQHSVEYSLQVRATRALFRASVLTQLAAQLDA
jgi:glycosyltransferase involved in cell wall biosynthesis